MTEHPTLGEALAAFQAELPKLLKDERASVKGETKDGRPYDKSYDYADLAQVVQAVLPPLGRHGLAFTTKPTMTEKGFGLVYRLIHGASGEVDEGFWPIQMAAPQLMGSNITYARRYALMAVTGVFPDKEDDDGKAASTAPAPVARPNEAPPRQAPPPKTWTDADVADMHAKLSQLDLNKALQLYDWMAGKGLHGRELAPSDMPDHLVTATELVAMRMADTAVLDNSTVPQIRGMRDEANGRGLLKVQVSEQETLDQVLAEMLALRNAEALDTENVRALRSEAAKSWEDGDE